MEEQVKPTTVEKPDFEKLAKEIFLGVDYDYTTDNDKECLRLMTSALSFSWYEYVTPLHQQLTELKEENERLKEVLKEAESKIKISLRFEASQWTSDQVYINEFIERNELILKIKSALSSSTSSEGK